MRSLYFSLGCIAFCTGFVGVFLPLLPTTPFMIIALWSFSRSSPRFHNWLYTHQLFGPPLQQWDKFRVIPPLAKILSVFLMAASLAYLCLYVRPPIWVILLTASVMTFGSWFILTKPSYRPDP